MLTKILRALAWRALGLDELRNDEVVREVRFEHAVTREAFVATAAPRYRCRDCAYLGRACSHAP